ncbi:MAG: type III pantothenate kinase [Gammaproteobacteria bacterium]|nr:type III pantothenate kinase [Gammaproteobacteria bacterium]
MRRAKALAAWCRGQWDVEARFADALTEVPGLENRYANPAQLGVDRWLALIAARRLGGGPVVVVDCGTAITVDLVDGAGVFHGGMILPGRRLLESAFTERVAHLELPAERPKTFPADNTAGRHRPRASSTPSLPRWIDSSKIAGRSPGTSRRRCT